MSNFEFNKESDVYIYASGTYYKLHVNSINFSQSFRQGGYNTKTLHNQHELHKGSTINSANPAEFSFTIPFVQESNVYQHIPLQLALVNTEATLGSFELYIDPSIDSTPSSDRKMYRITSCFIRSASLSFSPSQQILIDFVGEGSKLTRLPRTTFNYTTNYIDTSNLIRTVSKKIEVTVDSVILSSILRVNLEIQNNFSWNANETVHNTLEVNNATTSVYPTDVTLSDRILSGSIVQYVGNTASNLHTWKENIPIRIRAAYTSSYQFDAQLTPCSFTNRLNPGDVFTQAYDFRLMGKQKNLNKFFNY